MDYHADDFDPGEDALVTSTTDFKTFTDCPRKWYLTRIAKMPQADNPAFRVGSVLHLCVERWLLSERDVVPAPIEVPEQPVDENGNYTPGSVLFGQTPGSKVSLFPHEWWRYQERGGQWKEINEEDQALVQSLVHHGIDSGVLNRLPGGKVEKKFWLPIADNRWLTSLADYHSPDMATLEDHKTTKSLRWAVREDNIHLNQQLQIYALWMREAYGLDDGVHVAHNIFIKDYLNPRSKKVTGFIGPDLTDKVRTDLERGTAAMLDLRSCSPDDWEQAEPHWGSCEKYGGCPYRGICSGLETPTEFEDRMNPSEAPKPQMAAAPPPAAAPAPQAEPVKPNVESARGRAPWADHSCPVCGGTGVQVDGPACTMCVSRTGISPGDYQWGWDADGTFVIVTESQPEPEPVAAPAPEPEPVVAPEAVAEPEPEPEPVEAPKGSFREDLTALDKTGKRGRAPKRLTIMHDCAIDGVDAYPFGKLQRVLEDRYQDEFGASYWEADVWARREWATRLAQQIASDLSKDYLFVPSGLYEFRGLITALEGYAERVIRGVPS